MTADQLRRSIEMGFPLRLVLFVLILAPTTLGFGLVVFAQGCWHDGVREACSDTRYWTAEFFHKNWQWTHDPRLCA